jgi:ABC-type glutathione transport system ATPase component
LTKDAARSGAGGERDSSVRDREPDVRVPDLQGAFMAVDSVDLTVDPGDIVALVGESG